jgi:crossover junction endodeoxyribonuclease RuvC
LIRSATGTPLAERLHEIDGGVEEVLDEHQVDLLVIEDLFAHYRHPRTAILMGHARGVVLLAAARHGIEVLSVTATAIKKALTGNGHASKLQVQRAIMATFGLQVVPEPPDVADALATAFYAISVRYGEGRRAPSPEVKNRTTWTETGRPTATSGNDRGRAPGRTAKGRARAV